MLLLRRLLWLCLACLCTWQSYQSLMKYLDFAFALTIEEVYPTHLSFPSITICPHIKEGNEDEVEWFDPGGGGLGRFALTFPQGVFQSFKQTPENETTVSFNKSKENAWSLRQGFSLRSLKLHGCLTYTRKDARISPGLDSALDINLDVSKVSTLTVFVHDPMQDAFVVTPLYGTKVAELQVGEVDINELNRWVFMIRVTEHFIMNTKYLPCYVTLKAMRTSMMSCVEDFFQREEGCVLPWNAMNGGGGNVSECSSGREMYDKFIQVHKMMNNDGPLDLYSRTGCYYSCQFRSFELDEITKISSSERPRNGTDFNFNLALFLSSGGVTQKTQILAYDGYALLGDVGGFLGLFLGVSIMSFYDAIVGQSDRIKKAIAGGKEKPGARA